jgi:hypothetical protein
MRKNNAFGEYSLREKSVTAVIVVLLLSLSVSLISITAGAEADVGVYLSTDKPYYTYGQSGKLYVAIRNEETGPIEIKNISVTFPWFGWYNGKWDGNETIKDIDDAIAGNATSDTYVVSFSVPAEGRDVMAYTNVQVGYLWGDELHYEPGSIYISIETPVTQNPNLTPILYLMGIDTVLLILVIIGLAYVWMRKQTPLPSATG